MVEHKCTKDKIIDSIVKAQIESDKKDVLQSEQILNMQSDVRDTKEWMKLLDKKMQEWFTEIKNMLSWLDERYPTRREFKAVSLVIGLFATLIWIISFFTR